jgi:MurNAc alpha-1-phosphate uridylyltransferase
MLNSGMILAAGLGLRMRPLTLDRPKPLLEVAGRSMLDRAIDAMTATGVSFIIVNHHYLGEQIPTHLAGRNICFSDESALLLETGGGVKKALPSLGEGAFFVINGDIVWQDGATPALSRLFTAWNEAKLDALLLLAEQESAIGYAGAGDFFLEEDGTLRRRGQAASAPYVFAGVQILHSRLFADAPEGPFSLNLLYDKALSAGRLAGLAHDGQWFHVGDPAGLAEADAILRKVLV